MSKQIFTFLWHRTRCRFSARNDLTKRPHPSTDWHYWRRPKKVFNRFCQAQVDVHRSGPAFGVCVVWQHVFKILQGKPCAEAVWVPFHHGAELVQVSLDDCKVETRVGAEGHPRGVAWTEGCKSHRGYDWGVEVLDRELPSLKKKMKLRCKYG